MGFRNYLIEGTSGSGKTSVCHELQSRGYHSIHGDRELAYQGDPETGEPLPGFAHEHHIWNVAKLGALVADQSHPETFFCGGSRNFDRFIHMFDKVFVLEIDLLTLSDRLSRRPKSDWGGNDDERKLIAQLHTSKTDIPNTGVVIDATVPVSCVVDEILRSIIR
jgi:hypothetical protein